MAQTNKTNSSEPEAKEQKVQRNQAKLPQIVTNFELKLGNWKRASE